MYAARDAAARRIARARLQASRNAPLDRDEWRAIIALCVLFLPVTLFWAAYEQQGNTIALWADGYTDRTINLLFWRGEIPVTWFQAFNPFMIFAFTPFIIALWALAGEARTRAVDRVQDGARLLRRRAANLILVAAAWHAGGGKASWLWLFAFFVVLTLGELYLSPIGLSLVTKIAPARIVFDDDGSMARAPASYRQFSRGLSRQLLEQHGQGRFLPDDRGDRRARGCRGDAVQPAAEIHAQRMTFGGRFP